MAIDAIVRKYGDFGSPYSYSNGPQGTLNPTNVALLIGETTALFVGYSTSDLVYLEKAATNFIFNFTGAALIGQLYGSFMPQSKLYAQININAQAKVTRVGPGRYRVEDATHGAGEVANNTCVVTPGCYPTSYSQTETFSLYGNRYHEYVKVCVNGENVYKQALMVTGGFFSYRLVTSAKTFIGGPIYPI